MLLICSSRVAAQPKAARENDLRALAASVGSSPNFLPAAGETSDMRRKPCITHPMPNQCVTGALLSAVLPSVAFCGPQIAALLEAACCTEPARPSSCSIASSMVSLAVFLSVAASPANAPGAAAFLGKDEFHMALRTFHTICVAGFPRAQPAVRRSPLVCASIAYSLSVLATPLAALSIDLAALALESLLLSGMSFSSSGVQLGLGASSHVDPLEALSRVLVDAGTAGLQCAERCIERYVTGCLRRTRPYTAHIP
jgi:hypothetical protein